MSLLGRLRARMEYDAATGQFRAKVRTGRRDVGDVLGYVKDDGYRMVFAEGRWHYAHRLAWLFITGDFPANELDHINGQRDDNRSANLRACTRSQNMANTKKRGVCFHTKNRKWQASIRKDGKRFHLGTFDTEDQAAAAYASAAARLHGEFANVPRTPEPVQEPLFSEASA